MMASGSSPAKLYVFGDQTFAVQQRHIKSLIHSGCANPIVSEFLRRAYAALEVEVQTLRAEDRQRIPRLRNITDIVRKNPATSWQCIPLDMAALCLYELGTFMSHAGPEYPSSQDGSLVLGICTGALAAAAVSCSESTLGLIPLAVEAVRIAFRTGVLVDQMRRQFDNSSTGECADDRRSWSLALSGPGVQELFDEALHGSTVSPSPEEDGHFPEPIPPTAQPWISSMAPLSITVSGPPDALAQIAAAPRLQSVRQVFLPCYGPYHAPRLFTTSDVRDVLSRSVMPCAGAGSKLPFLSCTTGKSVQATSFTDALRIAIEDILLPPIRWDRVLENLRERSQALTVVPIATTAGKSICVALKQERTQPCVAPTPDAPRPSGDQIAVVGMSGRFPTAANITGFWSVLLSGFDTSRIIRSTRWPAETHVDPTLEQKNTSAAAIGCWLPERALEFDAPFFSMSAAAARKTDPAHRLALLTAYEALEHSGFVPDATPSTQSDRVGVVYGVGSDEWRECNAGQDIDEHVLAGSNNFIPSHIANVFGLHGPAVAVRDNSLTAIHQACRALLSRDIDTCLVGGVNVMTNPDMHAALDRAGFLSRTGNCATFDDSAKGYCRGEGAAALVLKRLEDAVAEGDVVVGVIADTCQSQAHHREGFSQRETWSRLLARTGTDPTSVEYVEVNNGRISCESDAAAVSDVQATFSPPSTTVRAKPLYLGSANANIGHGEAAAGVCSMVKALLMLQLNTIPPHIGIKTRPNSTFPSTLAERNVHFAINTAVPWRRSDSSPRRVVVSSTAITGSTTAVLVEDPPAPTGLSNEQSSIEDGVDGSMRYVVAISAKSDTSLQRNVAALRAWLHKNSDASLPSLSYTTTARRIHHPHRIMFAASSIPNLCMEMDAVLDNPLPTRNLEAGGKPSMVFSFAPSKLDITSWRFLRNLPLFRWHLESLNKIARRWGFPSVIDALDPASTPSDLDVAASDAKFASTMPSWWRKATSDRRVMDSVASKLTNACVQIAIAKLWRSWGVVPEAVVAHDGSLGSMYAALHAGGVFSDTDVVFLIGAHLAWLRLMEKGEESAGEEPFEKIAPRMAVFRKPWASLILARATGPLTMNGDNFNAEQLARDLGNVRPIMEGRKKELVLACHELGILSKQSVVLEISANPAVLEATDETTIFEQSPVPQVADYWRSLTSTLRHLYSVGYPIDWVSYHQSFNPVRKPRLLTDLPSYAWDQQEYWIPYTHDWCLRKGDPPLVITAPKLERTTIHRVLEEKETQRRDKVHMLVECDIAREDLNGVVQGHVVEGIPLCTPSVYADIALSAGEYLHGRYRPKSAETLIAVSDMTVTKALIAQPVGPQLLHTTIDVDWPSNSALCKFVTFDRTGSPHQHAWCNIRFTDEELPKQLEKFMTAATCQSRIEALRSGLATEQTTRFTRQMAYGLVRSLATFHPNHRLVSDLILDSTAHEIVARVTFETLVANHSGDMGVFHTHPAVMDALTQPAGFAMNLAEGTDLEKEAYINHGWAAFHIFEPLDLAKTYTVYVLMAPTSDPRVWAGDIMVLDEDKIVATFQKYSVQALPRRTLRILLGAEGGLAHKAAVARQQATTPELARSPIRHKPPTPKTPTRHRPKPIKVSAPKPSAPACPPTPASGSRNSSTAFRALGIIADETGIPLSELTDDVDFSGAGVDSLLSLQIAGRFREELGLDLDLHTLFLEYCTIGRFKESVLGTGGLKRQETKAWLRRTSTGDTVSGVSFAVASHRDWDGASESSGGASTGDTGDYSCSTPCAVVPRATSVFLQGSPGASKTLILFPDGSGSATAYASIPAISPKSKDVAVIGLNCPYLKSAQTMHSVSLDVLLRSGYLPELRRRQPSGPYHIGGWSAGGSLAYRAAQILASEGEKVASLVLIDAPVPRGMDPLPAHFFEYCERLGLFGGWSGAGKKGGKAPEWLIPHFNATIAVLRNYFAVPLRPKHCAGMRVGCLWAAESVVDRPGAPPLPPHPDDTEGMKFLTVRRTDFSGAGWETLVPGAELICEKIEGAHHFSLTREPFAAEVARMIRNVMRA